MRIALYEPRIPQNTGNIGRTCLAFDYSLDLILPLGFKIESKYIRRAGLDYWKFIDVQLHSNFESYKKFIGSSRLIGFSKHGGRELSEIKFHESDCLLFGREDSGLPSNVRDKCDLMSTIAMPGIASNSNLNGVRSLNLAVACGIASYKAFQSFKRG